MGEQQASKTEEGVLARLRGADGAPGLRRAGRAALAAVAMAVCGTAGAQPVTELSYFEELPVVLSPSRMPQPLNTTPGAVTVFDREFILATGYRDLPSLLKLVPGFHVVRERGGVSHVTYHGLGNAFPNRMQVLVDGRSVYSMYFLGGVDWHAVPVTIDEIERIEVLRGSNSATYGSNAALGVVNIVTRAGGERPGTEASLALGTNSLVDAGVSHDLRSGPLGLRLHAQTRYDHGFASLVDSPRHGVASVRADYRLNARDELTVSAALNDARRGLGFDGDPVNANGLRALRTENASVGVRWQRSIRPGEDLQVAYYHTQEHATERLTAYLPPFFPTVPIDYDRTATRDNLHVQHLFSPAASTRLVWGLELRRDAIRYPRFFYGVKEVDQNVSRAFANLEWKPVGSVAVNAGAMVERYSGRGTDVAPRLFLNWQVAPGHTLRAGQSVAYRASSIAEERMDMRFYSAGYSGVLLRVSYVGQPDVRRERVQANEIGYLGQFRTWNGVLDVRLFNEKITDFIQDIAIPAPPGVVDPRSYTFVNVDVPVRLRGFEAEYSARPAPGALLRAGYSNLSVSAPFANQSHEREGPHHSGSVTWMQEWTARWHTTLSVIRYSGYEWGSGSLPVPSYTVLDARIAYRFGPRSRLSEIALVALDQGRRHTEYAPSGDVGPGGVPRANEVPRAIFLTGRFAF